MKRSIIFTIFLVFVFSISIQGQNYSRLQNTASNIERAADSLVSQTSRQLSRNRNNSNMDIQHAFIAQQFSASAKLMSQMINSRFRLNDLRTAENSLSSLARSFPRLGSFRNEWQNARNSVAELNRELSGGGFGTRNNNNNNNNNVGGRAFWNGRVDAVLQLAIRGRRITSRTVSGTTYPDGKYNFIGNLPLRGNVTIGVNKTNGRGDVRIVQQPNRFNNFTAIIEIRDSSGGADNYSLEIYWNP